MLSLRAQVILTSSTHGHAFGDAACGSPTSGHLRPWWLGFSEGHRLGFNPIPIVSIVVPFFGLTKYIIRIL